MAQAGAGSVGQVTGMGQSEPQGDKLRGTDRTQFGDSEACSSDELQRVLSDDVDAWQRCGACFASERSAFAVANSAFGVCCTIA